MAMANETVTLLRSARIPGFGWRRGKAIIGKTGKVVPDYMLIGKGEDRELHHPLARSCQLRPAGFGLGVLLQSPNLVSVKPDHRAF